MTQIYLDNASTSYPKPEAVYRAVEEFARSCGASPGRGAYPSALFAAAMISKCRAALGSLLGVEDATRIAFGSNATECLNWALKGLLVRPGDHAVTTSLEHNAVLRPLHNLARKRGIQWTVVRCEPDGTLEPAAVAAAIRPETRVVCAVHGSNVLGTILPVGEIVRAAHARGVPVLVDGSQTAGALPFSVDELEIDLFAFTGHKSLLGPPGTGGLFVRDGLHLETWKEGGTGVLSESLDPPDWMPERLEAGTANSWGLAGLLAGVETLLEQSVKRVREREVKLTRTLGEGLRGINGVTVYGPKDAARKVGIVSMNIGSLPSSDVGRLLAERYGIAVRTGLHCSPLAHGTMGTARAGGAVRFGIGMFTTTEDVDAAIAAVGEIAWLAHRRKAPLAAPADRRDTHMAGVRRENP